MLKWTYANTIFNFEKIVFRKKKAPAYGSPRQSGSIS